MTLLAVRPIMVQVAGTDVTLVVTTSFANRPLEEIALTYDIESIAYDLLDDGLKKAIDGVLEYRPLPSRLRHATLYVSLEPSAGTYTISRVSLERPSHSLYLIAKAFNVRLDDDNRQLIVRYGLPKQTHQDDPDGRLLQALRETGTVYATVRIYHGHARVQKLDTQIP